MPTLSRASKDLNRPTFLGPFSRAKSVQSTFADHERYTDQADRITNAEKMGAKSFRVFGDMIGARDKMGAEPIAQLEERFDRIIAGTHPVIAMCAYDVQKFTGVELLTALKAHRDGFQHSRRKA